jgi:hypothetical protein
LSRPVEDSQMKKPFQLILLLALLLSLQLGWYRSHGTKKKLHRESVYGVVIFFEKGNKGNYIMKINQDDKIRQINFQPGESRLMVSYGDSVYKKSNSDIFYVRYKESRDFIRTDWKDIHIGGKWEK